MIATIAAIKTIATEQLDCCPLCNSKNIQKWCEGRDRLYEISLQKFTYSSCLDCTAVFLSNRPIESEIYKFYPEDYCAYESSSKTKKAQPLLETKITKPVEYIFPNGFDEKYKAIYNPTEKQAPKLLDFGCGAGKFLTKSRKLGWQTIGIDFSPVAIAQVLDNGHQGFLISDTLWENLEDESIDFIRMNHVLEHLYHPLEILTELKKKMKVGATLHISVPNPYSISAKIFGSRWFSLDCPRHIILYSPKLLKQLLQNLGFSEFYVLNEIVTKDFARSLVYLFNDYGFGSREDVNKVLKWKSLNNLLYLPAKLAANREASDRFHIFVKK
jgi:2-polyprenyl-3-methyl-5-hydroxy-6-metoxy-1,4-benzoquinol methylase